MAIDAGGTQPAKRAFLRKGAHMDRYQPEVVRARFDAKLAAKAAGGAQKATMATPRPDQPPLRPSPLSAARTVDRAEAGRDPWRALHQESMEPPRPSLAERFSTADHDLPQRDVRACAPPTRQRGVESPIEEFEALEQLAHTVAAELPAPSKGWSDTGSFSAARTTPERRNDRMERSGGGDGDGDPTKWWDQLYSTLQMHLPDSPEKPGELAVPTMRPSATSAHTHTALGAHALRPAPGASSAAASEQLPHAASNTPPTSRLVASLFHGNGGGRGASARRPASAAARHGTQPAVEPVDGTAGSHADASAADAALVLDAEREALAQERMSIVRQREKARRADMEVAERAQELQARERELAEERATFEKWREVETSRLAKEQKTVERQARVLLKLPDREERREVAQLRAELQLAQDASTQREQRAKLALDRLRKQLAAEAEEKVELRREVAILSSAATAAVAAPAAPSRAAAPRAPVPPAAAALASNRLAATEARPLAHSARGALLISTHMDDDDDDDDDISDGYYHHSDAAAPAAVRGVATHHERSDLRSMAEQGAPRQDDARALIRDGCWDDDDEVLLPTSQTVQPPRQPITEARVELMPKRLVGGMFHSPLPQQPQPQPSTFYDHHAYKQSSLLENAENAALYLYTGRLRLVAEASVYDSDRTTPRTPLGALDSNANLNTASRHG